MGGRGAVRFATQWTEKQLSKRVQELEAQIRTIDEQANAVYRDSYQKELEHYSSYSFMSEDERKETARELAQADKTDFIAETNRSELARERYQRLKELDVIKSGQKTLFG